ncbi:MAG: ATP-binding protein [Gemmatimonadetes bacterium]|nr:ATP-binding protein [Gemmatimonadota bacterium]
MRYLPRVVDEELDELLRELPAVAIEGPKGVGKTETARRRARTVYQLDDPATLAIVNADPAQVLEAPTPILLDEWQHVPAVWDAVRRAVDRDRTPNQYLLTGSAAPSPPPRHSGAGRIITVRMRPLTLWERGVVEGGISMRELVRGGRPSVEGTTHVTLRDYVREIVASGLPGLRGLGGRALRSQLDGYVRHVVDRDFEEQGLKVRRPEALLRWMTAYAAATGTAASLETIRDAATSGEGEKPAKTTVQAYRDVLQRLWLIDSLPAWIPSRNQINRLSQPPKHHLADPALAVRLLGLDADALLRGEEHSPPIARDGALLGSLFESLVTLCVRVYAQAAEASVKHLRLQNNRREVDLIVERADQRVVAIEVKLGATVRDDDVKHLLWLRDQLGGDYLDGIVINTGPQAYRRKDGIAVIPAALLGP